MSRVDAPSRNEEFTHEGWTFRCSTSHILPSQCTQPCDSNTKLCSYCLFTKELPQLPHLPEMVYPNNRLEIVHDKSGSVIEFNALDALKLVKSENKSVKIACAEDWRRARQDTGLVDKTIGEFDWTFSTDYCGTMKNWAKEEETQTVIDTNKLRQKEEILLYKEVTLFEDELHDNGIALCSVRIRVMPSGYFALLRYFLRVDGVILSVYDTRVYHDFTTNYVLTESTHREGKVSEMKLPIYKMNEPDEVTPLIPLEKTILLKLILPADKGKTFFFRYCMVKLFVFPKLYFLFKV
ncbi:hypothetical protein AAG570_003036 [Ranatra chinensis]|uniref:TIP41-like protein n=1 Tax=Ranatra chinensis TaxID=642074 RepID=A0ABD0Y6Q7_9HEMI